MGSLLDLATMKFTRGEYEGWSLEKVVKKDLAYVMFLIENSETDDGTKETIEDYLDDNPDLLTGVEV